MNDDLSLYQWGIEATPGTLVAATSKMAVGRVDVTSGGIVVRPNLATGQIVRNKGHEAVAKYQTNFKVPAFPLSYEQHQNWLSMGIGGGVTPTGGPTDYVWVYSRDMGIADPQPDSYTIQRRITEGSSPVDERFGYALASSLTWRGALDDLLTLEVEGFGRRMAASGLTADLDMPESELAPMAKSSLYINDAFSDAGDSVVPGVFLGFTIKFMTGLYGQMTGDKRSDLDFTSHKVNGRNVGLDVQLLLLVDSGTWGDEKTAAAAQALRAVRIQVEGSANRKITWDMALKYSTPDLIEVAQRDGQSILSLNLVESGEDGDNLITVTTTNQVASIT